LSSSSSSWTKFEKPKLCGEKSSVELADYLSSRFYTGEDTLNIHMYLWVIGEIVLEYVLHIFREDSVSDGKIRKVHLKGRRVFQIGGTPVMQPVIVPQNLYKGTHKRQTKGPFFPPLPPQIQHHPPHRCYHCRVRH
jgi:hypothetical protein